MIRLILLCCIFSCLLNAQKIDTFYGPLDIEEPVLLELIESPAFQRLKDIHFGTDEKIWNKLIHHVDQQFPLEKFRIDR